MMRVDMGKAERLLRRTGKHRAGGMPQVRTSDGHMVTWRRKFIVEQLLRETKLTEEFFKVQAITKGEAEKVAKTVEDKIRSLGLKFVSAPLIREMVNNVLLELSEEDPRFALYRNVCTRCGAPVYDVYQIFTGRSKYVGDDYQKISPELSHRRLADLTAKEATLLLLPPSVADSHLRGDIHIHQLEYFCTRPACQALDLRYFLYYGLTTGGEGQLISGIGPPKSPYSACMVAVYALLMGCAYHSLGVSLLDLLIMLAPYMAKLSQEQAEELLRLLLMGLSQSLPLQGRRLLNSSIQLSPIVTNPWHRAPVVMAGSVCDDVYGNYEEVVRKLFLSFMRILFKSLHEGGYIRVPRVDLVLNSKVLNEVDDDIARILLKAVRHGVPLFVNNLSALERAIECYCCFYHFQESSSTTDFEDCVEFKGGKHFSLGAKQVVSINMPRLAYKAKGDDDKLLEYARRAVDLCINVFKTKEEWLRRMMRAGRLFFLQNRPPDPRDERRRGEPLTYFEKLDYVVALIGFEEMLKFHTGHSPFEDRSCLVFAIKLLDELRRYAELWQAKGIRIRFAMPPHGEGNQRLAVCDLVIPSYRYSAKKAVKGRIDEASKMLRRGVRDLPVYYTSEIKVRISERRRLEHVAHVTSRLDGGAQIGIVIDHDVDEDLLRRYLAYLIDKLNLEHFYIQM